ncbi:MAG: hypothetical protein KF713_05670 [Turneriella sp.]|nr:hypothetical protein [Turneriella sp.]
MLKNVAFISVLSLTWAAACSRAPNKTEIRLEISENHQKLFEDVKHATYDEADGLKLLGSLAEKSDGFCADAIKGKFSPGNFLNVDAAKTAFADWDQSHFQSARLGCRNWYTMTDLHPEFDFSKINVTFNPRALQKFDCYAVGYLQPYIMAANLNCARLSIIDVDFRILKAHLDLLKAMRERTWTNLDQLFEKVKYSFPAGNKRKGNKHDIDLTLSDLCGENSTRACAAALIRFMEKLPSLSEVNLVLSPLHEFKFPAKRDELISVFYTSNAFDPHFTSEAHFKEFMAKLRPIAESRDRVVIYHQSEEKSFGVYQLTNENTVTTVCADKFKNVVEGRYSADRCRYFPGKTTVYENYFDQLAKGRHPEKCSE